MVVITIIGPGVNVSLQDIKTAALRRTKKEMSNPLTIGLILNTLVEMKKRKIHIINSDMLAFQRYFFLYCYYIQDAGNNP